jgi:GT2 family glycosyltransferase
MPQLSIVIIGYNSGKFLKSCLESLSKQTYKNLELIFIDNNSSDGSIQFVDKHFPHITTIHNKQNIGYVGAANQGIKLAKGDFVMILNPDILFEPNYIELCMEKIKTHHEIAAIAGKIYKYDFEKKQKTGLIDTVGIFCFRNRRFIDDGQGMEDKGQFSRPKEVFGVSGACPIYRKKALEDVKYQDEYLDENFFMYKEDVDLAWRLKLYGWKAFYIPTAVAYHGRGTGALKRFTHREVLKNRSKLNKFQKYHSYKNQRLMQLKNEYLKGFLSDFPHIAWREILIAGYVLLREPHLLKAWWHMVKQIPSTLKKRSHIMKNAKLGWKEMQKFLKGRK